MSALISIAPWPYSSNSPIARTELRPCLRTLVYKAMIPFCEVFKERFGQQILLNLAMITHLEPQGMTMDIIHRRCVKGLPEASFTRIPACQERS